MIKAIVSKLKSSNWLESILTHSGWYLLASLSTKALGFILLPIYTQYLTTADYGVLTSIEVINYLLPFFFSFMLVNAFDRFYHQKISQPNYLSHLFSSIFWFVMLLGSLVVTLIILSSYFWMPHFWDIPAYPYSILGFVPSLLTELSLLGFAFFRQSLQAKKISLILIGSALINIAISLYLIVGLEMGVIGKLWGNLGGAIFSFFTVLSYAWKKQLIQFVVHKALLKECLTYSIPLMPLAASHWINIFSDRLIIEKYESLDEVGIYSIAFHISMVLYFVGESIVQVIVPISMKGLENNKEGTKDKLGDYAFYLWTFLLLGCLFACVFAKPIIAYFLDPSFLATHTVIPILCLAIVFQMIHRLYGQVIKFHKKTTIFTVGAIGSSCLNLLLNLIFIPKYGYIAAAYTTLAVSILYAFFIVWQSNKIALIDTPYVKYFLTTLLFFFLIVSANTGDFSFIWRVLLFLGVSGLLVYMVISRFNRNKI
ncbi:MAG: lipopolysaccharide biosynthesis protein [Saprospiraceae bacterium]